MTQFNSRPLTVLQRIWNFVGGLGPTGLKSMQLSGDILPVNDVSRMAMLGSGHGTNEGYYIFKMVNIHAVAGSITDQLNMYDPANVFGTFTALDPEKEWLWIMGAWGASTVAANMSLASMALNAGTGGSPFTLLGAFEPAGQGAGVEESQYEFFHSEDTNANGFMDPLPNVLFTRPFVVPFAMGVLNWRTTAVTGAVNIRGVVLVWRGPKGTTPPGIV